MKQPPPSSFMAEASQVQVQVQVQVQGQGQGQGQGGVGEMEEEEQVGMELDDPDPVDILSDFDKHHLPLDADFFNSFPDDFDDDDLD